MTEPETPPPPESLTAWHPMLVALLEIYLPSGWQIIPELLLSRLPQRVDIVILELVDTAPGVARKLLSIFNFLRPHTLIEHKGPTDDLAAEDALVLLAYGAQYMRLKKLKDPADLCLMVIADRIPPAFVEQVARLQGCLTQVGKGLWRGELAGAVLHAVETGEAAQRGPTERLLYTFSRAFLKDPRGGLPLDEEARKVYALLQNQVEQFRKIRGVMAMKDYELAKISLEELLQPALERHVQKFTPEQIGKILTPEQRVAGLTPEEITKMLTPEQLAQTLTPEQRVAGLTPGELVKVLTPEQFMEMLTPEQLMKMLTPEQFAQRLEQLMKMLTPEQFAQRLEMLPPEMKEQLKQRLH